MIITACQINPLVGDTAGNAARICDCLVKVAGQKPDLVVFSELCIQGYPPRDLLEQQWFIQNSLSAVEKICRCSEQFPDTAVLLGTALPNTIPRGKGLSNSAVLIQAGKILFHQNKSLLPTYDVFDEHRYFDPARSIDIFEFKGERLGITICEDAWNDPEMWVKPLYEYDPVDQLACKGATLMINISASPFHMGKETLRSSLVRNHARKHRVPFLFVNQVGGNDELIFDGNSMFFDNEGVLRKRLPAFREASETFDTCAGGDPVGMPQFDTIGAVHDALVTGLGDYVRKCGFTSVIMGLSGGIDSAVTCALAARAVGPQHVWGVSMPSRYSSEGSGSDARKLAENLGITYKVLPIEGVFASYLETLAPQFEGTDPGVAEENLQARIRGTLLMALSNKFGHLLLSTGNKSELAVGYSTLYGDMNGGLSVISDLPKDMIYKLARYINSDREIIPPDTLTKAPSAELRPNQTDQDTLPPYPVLDSILAKLIEGGKSSEEIIAEGFDRTTVKWIVRAISTNEYKRRQAPPGLKVTPKAFGIGRRFPIAARYEW
jgi:NAD+ synthase (glutamine-hydrolysing)